jgi:hypothetical protein
MLQLQTVSMQKPASIPVAPAIYADIRRCPCVLPGTSTGIIPVVPISPLDSEKPFRSVSSTQNLIDTVGHR